MSKKISELTSLSYAETTDVLPVVDVSESETKNISLSSLSTSCIEAFVSTSTEKRFAKRVFLRGHNLGNSVTDEQKNEISNGTFKNIYIGDYWLINGLNWRVADMDYWYNCGDTAFTRHHLVIMPDGAVVNAKMNDTNTTVGGYTGSKMYTETLPTVKAACEAAFPSMVLTHREYLVNAVTDGKPSGGEWVDSSVELPSEIMMFGSHILSPANDGATVPTLYTIDKQQLALFNLAPRLISNRIGSTSYWLRDPVSAEAFVAITAEGLVIGSVAPWIRSIRPVFPIG